MGVSNNLNEAPCIVGKMYRVPAILIDPTYLGMRWVPVFGTKHTDPQLEFKREHWHIDWRFVPEEAFYQATTYGISKSALSRIISSTHPHDEGLLREPGIKLRKCRRPMPEFPAVTWSKVWAAFSTDMQKRCPRLIDGHTCPHRGVDLRPFAKPDGTAICPGHGLRWNLLTGEMLPYHALAPTYSERQ